MIFCLKVGYAVTTNYQDDCKSGMENGHTPSTVPVIGFDMGGTSTDVSRYDGEYEHIFESNVGGVAIQAPQVSVVGGYDLGFFDPILLTYLVNI
jgi:hypothetical protein